MPSYPFDAPSYRCYAHGGVPEPGCYQCSLNQTRRGTDRERGDYSRRIIDAANEGRTERARELYRDREDTTSRAYLGSSQSDMDRIFGSGRETNNDYQTSRDRDTSRDRGYEYSSSQSRDPKFSQRERDGYSSPPSRNAEYPSSRSTDRQNLSSNYSTSRDRDMTSSINRQGDYSSNSIVSRNDREYARKRCIIHYPVPRSGCTICEANR